MSEPIPRNEGRREPETFLVSDPISEEGIQQITVAAGELAQRSPSLTVRTECSRVLSDDQPTAIVATTVDSPNGKDRGISVDTPLSDEQSLRIMLGQQDGDMSTLALFLPKDRSPLSILAPLLSNDRLQGGIDAILMTTAQELADRGSYQNDQLGSTGFHIPTELFNALWYGLRLEGAPSPTVWNSVDVREQSYLECYGSVDTAGYIPSKIRLAVKDDFEFDLTWSAEAQSTARFLERNKRNLDHLPQLTEDDRRAHPYPVIPAQIIAEQMNQNRLEGEVIYSSGDSPVDYSTGYTITATDINDNGYAAETRWYDTFGDAQTAADNLYRSELYSTLTRKRAQRVLEALHNLQEHST